ncbi:hypothetical protein ETAA8_27350 [Anatilimnocola aggregata]|uniref:Uncharacterized protein n=1 Tax=Anatilimnocola aggregata TaxID=2528021 RepID=A0A517YBN1_9BACT|nr:hypothetical protein [Anatilimnocola aggregata]QDU27647.1 hypothetical protein ETAA8_27350 [Anatilimnocola aggregata]
MLKELFQKIFSINLKRVNCPECQTPLPTLRIPASAAQAQWGGWTCHQCGCQMDKWGTRQDSAKPVAESRNWR